MRLLIAGILLGASLIGASATSAFEDKAGVVSVQTSTTLDGSTKILCRYNVHEGVLIRRPECHSAQEWEYLLRNRQREISEAQQRSFMLGR